MSAKSPGFVARVCRALLERTAWFGVHHPRTVLIAATLVTAAAAWSASRLELVTDIESLIPKDVPAAARLQDLVERWGSSDPIVVAVSGEGEADLDDRIDLALAIRDRLEDRPSLVGMTGVFGEDPWSLLEGPQASALLLYLAPEDVTRVTDALDDAEIERRVALARDQLRSPIAPAASRLIAEDPLGIVSLAARHLGAIKGRLAITARDGTLVTEDGEYVLILVRATGPTNDYQRAQAFLDELEEVAREALDDLGLEGTTGIGPRPEESALPIHVGFTGAPAIIVDYRNILSHDVRFISLVGIAAVLTLFLLAFRRVTALFIAGIPLVVGMTWSLGFAGLFVGQISVFTAGSVSILSGLAIDYTIHLYNRYLEEVHAGLDMERAFKLALGETGLGILAAMATTACAFLAAGFSTFRGLRDLGLICAAGMVLSLAASFLLVPALTAIVVRLRPGPDRPRGLAGFGLAPVLRWVVGHPRTVVVLGVAATILCTIPAVSVHLDDDLRRFRPIHAPSIRLQDELAQRTGTSLQPVLALVPASTSDELVERSAALEAHLDDLVADGSLVTAVLGPGRVIPAPSAQRRALDALRAARAGGLDPARVEATLLAAMEREGFRMDERARRAAGRVRALLERDSVLTIEEASLGPLGPILDDLVIDGSRSPLEGIVSIYPGPQVTSRPLLGAIAEARDRSGVDAELAGARVLGLALRPIVLRDGIVSTSLSALAVLVILGLTFRRFVLMLVTFVPLLVGVLVSVGLMAALGIQFNLVSLSMLPLIFGIGIDNGIHIVHRFLGHTKEDLADVFKHTGRGIVMTSLTTMVGFGAMTFADYPGLRSSGALAILGVGATLVTAITLVPAFLTLIHVRDTMRREREAEASESESVSAGS